MADYLGRIFRILSKNSVNSTGRLDNAKGNQKKNSMSTCGRIQIGKDMEDLYK